MGYMMWNNIHNSTLLPGTLFWGQYCTLSSVLFLFPQLRKHLALFPWVHASRIWEVRDFLWSNNIVGQCSDKIHFTTCNQYQYIIKIIKHSICNARISFLCVVCRNVQILHSLMNYQLWLRYFNFFPSVVWGWDRRESYLKVGNDGNCSQTSEALCKLYFLQQICFSREKLQLNLC